MWDDNGMMNAGPADPSFMGQNNQIWAPQSYMSMRNSGAFPVGGYPPAGPPVPQPSRKPWDTPGGAQGGWQTPQPTAWNPPVNAPPPTHPQWQSMPPPQQPQGKGGYGMQRPRGPHMPPNDMGQWGKSDWSRNDGTQHWGDPNQHATGSQWSAQPGPPPPMHDPTGTGHWAQQRPPVADAMGGGWPQQPPPPQSRHMVPPAAMPQWNAPPHMQPPATPMPQEQFGGGRQAGGGGVPTWDMNPQNPGMWVPPQPNGVVDVDHSLDVAMAALARQPAFAAYLQQHTFDMDDRSTTMYDCGNGGNGGEIKDDMMWHDPNPRQKKVQVDKGTQNWEQQPGVVEIKRWKLPDNSMPSTSTSDDGWTENVPPVLGWGDANNNNASVTSTSTAGAPTTAGAWPTPQAAVAHQPSPMTPNAAQVPQWPQQPPSKEDSAADLLTAYRARTTACRRPTSADARVPDAMPRPTTTMTTTSTSTMPILADMAQLLTPSPPPTMHGVWPRHYGEQQGVDMTPGGDYGPADDAYNLVAKGIMPTRGGNGGANGETAQGDFESLTRQIADQLRVAVTNGLIDPHVLNEPLSKSTLHDLNQILSRVHRIDQNHKQMQRLQSTPGADAADVARLSQECTALDAEICHYRARINEAAAAGKGAPTSVDPTAAVGAPPPPTTSGVDEAQPIPGSRLSHWKSTTTTDSPATTPQTDTWQAAGADGIRPFAPGVPWKIEAPESNISDNVARLRALPPGHWLVVANVVNSSASSVNTAVDAAGKTLSPILMIAPQTYAGKWAIDASAPDCLSRLQTQLQQVNPGVTAQLTTDSDMETLLAKATPTTTGAVDSVWAAKAESTTPTLF